jgi:cytochrome c-type biogenesis protein
VTRSGGRTAFIAGAAFGAGWTPCIGPILTAILLMAGQSGKTLLAVFYLAAYCAGLGLPFLLAALFFDSLLKHGTRLRSMMPLIRRVSGILLVVIGVMILTGRYSALNGLIQKQVLGYIVWAETKALPFRLLADALVWIQSY